MELDELLQLLEIESPRDMDFFEQYADLVETESEIPLEALQAFFEEADRDALAELTDGYFEDMLKYIPDDATDFYALLATIGQVLGGLAAALDSEGNRQLYAEEFFKFRNWFMFDSEVICLRESDGRESAMPVMGALALYRAENLSDDEYSYDFSEAMDYQIDEVMMPVRSLAEEDEEEYQPFDDPDEEDI